MTFEWITGLSYFTYHSFKISERRKEKPIMNASTLLAYLPTEVDKRSCRSDLGKQNYVSNCSKAQVKAHSAFLNCIESAILRLAQVTGIGLECVTKDGKKLVFHTVLAQ